MKLKNILLAGLFLTGTAACNDDKDAPVFPEENEAAYDMSGFARGADVSWLTEMEANGYQFFNAQGKQEECMGLLRDLGMNAIRLRVWVNPENDVDDVRGWCNKGDVLVKAWRAHQLGYRIMIDFHYSDRWADPVQQAKPAAWANYSVDELKTAIAKHTDEVLQALKDKGIDVEWVQVGNETHQGMLFPVDGGNDVSGKIDTDEGKANFAAFVQSGYDAVKKVYPEAKVIVHLDQGQNASLYNKVFSDLKAKNVKWDVIGMSLYPDMSVEDGHTPDDWAAMNAACIANMQNLISTYGTEVMMCEIGIPWDYEEAEAFYVDFMSKAKNIDGCLGVFAWEPQCYGNWKNYSKGMFNDEGMPTASFNAFAR